MIDILEAVQPLKLVYFALGRSLRLKTADLKLIQQAYPDESDAEQALSDTLEFWLQKKYNAERFGPPTWRMLVEAVDRKAGGNSHELAKEIASNHPATGRKSTLSSCLQCVLILSRVRPPAFLKMKNYYVNNFMENYSIPVSMNSYMPTIRGYVNSFTL